MRAFPATKVRYDDERKGRESDDKLLNRLLDELQELRKKDLLKKE
jgi:hypothetical protein